MPAANVVRSATLIGPAGRPTANAIRVDSDTDTLKFGTGASGTTEKEVADLTSTQTLTNKTITAPVGLAATEVLTALDTLTDADSGKTIFLNSTTEFAVTLPAPTAGFRLTAIVKAAPSGASYTIVSPGANQIIGQVFTLDVNSATDPDFETAGSNTITLVDSKAVAGDRVEIWSDGTLFYAHAFCSVFDAITFTDV